MNRRILVLCTSTIALAVFGGASWYATRIPSTESSAMISASETPSDSSTATQTAETPFDPANLVRPHSPVLGPINAPVTIVEFFDPSCEACRAFHPILKHIREQFPKKVRIVIRYTTFHKGSDEAVLILEAARQQDLFEPVLEALLETQPIWAAHGQPNLEVAWQTAGRAGLDVEKGKAYRKFPGNVAILNQDAADVIAAGIRQTPTFFVNGKPMEKFGSEELIELVESEVNRL